MSIFSVFVAVLSCALAIVAIVTMRSVHSDHSRSDRDLRKRAQRFANEFLALLPEGGREEMCAMVGETIDVALATLLERRAQLWVDIRRLRRVDRCTVWNKVVHDEFVEVLKQLEGDLTATDQQIDQLMMELSLLESKARLLNYGNDTVLTELRDGLRRITLAASERRIRYSQLPAELQMQERKRGS